MDHSLGLAIIAFVLGFAGASYVYLLSLNERITITNNIIKWTGWWGKVRVECSLDALVQHTFRRRVVQGLATYSVTTTMGEVRWSNMISNCGDLVYTLSRLAKQSEYPNG